MPKPHQHLRAEPRILVAYLAGLNTVELGRVFRVHSGTMRNIVEDQLNAYLSEIGYEGPWRVTGQSVRDYVLENYAAMRLRFVVLTFPPSKVRVGFFVPKGEDK